MPSAFGQTFKNMRKRVMERAAEAVVDLTARGTRGRRTMLRRLFASYLAPGCRVLVDFEDHRFLVDPRDTGVGFTLMTGQPWQRAELGAALNALRAAGRLAEGGAFLDVGANIGTQTVYALLSGAFARAVALEPEPANFAMLRENVVLNGMTTQATLINAAASAQAGQVLLGIDARDKGSHSVARGATGRGALPSEGGAAIQVAAVTVDAACRDSGVAPGEAGLVWIDVEGHELAVLEGMAELRAARVPIIVEFDGTVQGAAGTRQLKALLEGYETVVDLRTLVRGERGAAQVPLADFAVPVGARDLLVW